MKKILILAATMIVSISCSQSPEQKVNALVKTEVKKVLYHPETYEAVETIIDSAFAPKDDPAFYEKTLKLLNYAMEIQKYMDKANDAEQEMSIWHSSYMDGFSKTHYNHAKQEYEDCIEQTEKLETKVLKVRGELERLAEPGRRFIGFKVTHKFRAKNNAGNAMIGKYVYIMNENLTEIVASYNADSEDYMGVQALYQHWEEDVEETID